jgi:enoyl-CoA hydratase
MNDMAAAKTQSGTIVELERSGKVATVRFTSESGPPIFSAPVLGDLGRMVEQLADEPCIQELAGLSEDQGLPLSKQGQHVFNAIENLPQITFAAINGHALGGGCELAIACSFRLMVAGASIGQPEVKLGLIPGWGATKRLPMIVPLSWALRMLYSGEAISAEQAEKIGLVDEVVPTAAHLDSALQRWFARFSECAPQAIIRIKRAILNDEQAHQFGLCFSCADAKEGMLAFLEKRNPTWVSEAECGDD